MGYITCTVHPEYATGHDGRRRINCRILRHTCVCLSYPAIRTATVHHGQVRSVYGGTGALEYSSRAGTTVCWGIPSPSGCVRSSVFPNRPSLHPPTRSSHPPTTCQPVDLPSDRMALHPKLWRRCSSFQPFMRRLVGEAPTIQDPDPAPGRAVCPNPCQPTPSSNHQACRRGHRWQAENKAARSCVRCCRRRLFQSLRFANQEELRLAKFVPSRPPAHDLLVAVSDRL